MTRLFFLISLVALYGGLISCSGSQRSTASSFVAKPTTYSKYYTSSFPAQDVTEQLTRAQQSVVRIVATGLYENYLFERQFITLQDINTNSPKKIASSYYGSEESTAGTSIIIDQTSDNSLLITCEHIVAFPDTVISYYEGDDIPPQTFIKSISLKKSQSNLVFLGTKLKSYDIISTDRRLDLALLNVDYGRDHDLEQHSLTTKFGDSSNLQLGSFLYILGFPKGYAMVTRGLASSAESWNDRFFTTDASFNPGISGGLILATNDNFSTFQWVGMASSATATREEVLIPRPQMEESSRAPRPYKDSIYVAEKTRINYGITQAIPINRIKDFLSDNKRAISQAGFSLNKNQLSSN